MVELGVAYATEAQALIAAGTKPMPQETNDDDPKKEGIFKACMVVIDDYLGDKGRQKGSYRLEKIDAGKTQKSRPVMRVRGLREMEDQLGHSKGSDGGSGSIPASASHTHLRALTGRNGV